MSAVRPSARTPAQHARTRSSSGPPESGPRRWGVILLIVLAVLVVAAAIWFFFLRGGGHTSSNGTNTGPGPKTPKFDFTVGSVKAIGTIAGGNKKGAGKAAVNAAGKDIADELSRMYGLAFLDPNEWQTGRYDEVYGFFTEGKTRDAAERQGSTLTLGKDAGSLYSDVQPKSRTAPVDLKILLDESGKPRLAAADLKFTGIATRKSGGAIAVVSKGHFVLRPASDGWEIYSFEVRRADHKGKAPKPAKSPKAKAT